MNTATIICSCSHKPHCHFQDPSIAADAVMTSSEAAAAADEVSLAAF